MAKLSLIAAPTFKAKVGIPVAGGPPVEVEFTFKHRTKKALDDWINSRNLERPARSLLDSVRTWERDGTLKPESAEVLKAALEDFIKANPPASDAKSFMDMAVGWELDDDFTAENVEALTENYAGAGLAAFQVYLDELIKARTKN